CVRVHAVLGAHGEPLEVPGTHEGLPGVGLGELAVVAQRLRGAGELGDGGDVGEEHAAGDEHVRRGLHALPGGEHVQDHTVHRGGAEGGGDVLEVADGEVP